MRQRPRLAMPATTGRLAPRGSGYTVSRARLSCRTQTPKAVDQRVRQALTTCWPHAAGICPRGDPPHGARSRREGSPVRPSRWRCAAWGPRAAVSFVRHTACTPTGLPATCTSGLCSRPSPKRSVRYGGRIEGALSGQWRFPDGFATPWQLQESSPSEVSLEETGQAERLMRS